VKKQNKKFKVKAIYPVISILIFLQTGATVFAQNEILSAPLPGGNVTAGNAYIPPVKTSEIQPSAQSQISNNENDKEKSNPFTAPGSEKLPVSINGLKALLDKYRQDAAEDDLDSDKLDGNLAWIDGLMRAHIRLANAFSKQSDLKSSFDNECSLIRQLRSIKNELLYIKAQSLIKGKKLKQAIPILVDITCSEPNSALGLKAYQHLTQSGFSGEGNSSMNKTENDIKASKER